MADVIVFTGTIPRWVTNFQKNSMQCIGINFPTLETKLIENIVFKTVKYFYLISPDLVKVLLNFSPLFIFSPKPTQDERNSNNGITLQTLDDVAGFFAVNSTNSSLQTFKTSIGDSNAQH